MASLESCAGLKNRSPVSGRPTKAPLLKITQGWSGPVVNFCQNTRNAAGVASPALVSFAWRSYAKTAIAITATTSRPASTSTSNDNGKDLLLAGKALVSPTGELTFGGTGARWN